MKIKYIEGDIFNNFEGVIAHGCNAKGGFGSGFAKAVKTNMPFAQKAYLDAYKMNNLFLGSVIWGINDKKDKIIANCITQNNYGPGDKLYASYDAIRACMKILNNASILGIPDTKYENGFDNIGMPVIGCDLAGGDWNIVKNIIEEELTDVNINVFILPESKFSYLIKETKEIYKK